VLELSLTDLHGAGHRFSDGAWTSLIKEYQMFTCQSAAGWRGADDRHRPGLDTCGWCSNRAEAVALRRRPREEAIPGLDMTSCLTSHPIIIVGAGWAR
jgi:hypothetical protein